MSKYSEEMKRMYRNTRKLRNLTDQYKITKPKDFVKTRKFLKKFEKGGKK